jgi:DNA-3-methyladenine glycosylase I
MSSYCNFVQTLDAQHPHVLYHNHEYGFPLQSDDELFGRLILEINQAGLSWLTILNKKENFRKAYANFSVAAVASFTEGDFQRLIEDKGIIRNKLKIRAAIHNAQVILAIQKEYGSFKTWLNRNHPQEKVAWVKLFKKHFTF